MKRRPLKLLVFLLAGAIINVAVAWGCVYRISFRPAWLTNWHEVESYWADGLAHFEFQEEHAGVQGQMYMRGLRCSLEKFAELENRRKDDSITRPAYVFAWSLQERSDVGVELLFESSSGWPLRSLRSFAAYSQKDTSPATLIRQSGIPLGHNPARPSRLPAVPDFPLFAINTIFYAAIVYALFAVPGAVRRRLRHKRGQCASCGYSLRESVSDKCPECGAVPASNRGFVASLNRQ